VSNLYDFGATTLAGAPKPLADYRGKVVLVINTASECGFTPQYTGLEALHRKYRDRGLAVLGFPCNQFGAQEPGDAAQIRAFCEKNYSVSFELFGKIDVKGANAHPLYRWLTREAPGILGIGVIKWNFTKFLIDKHGKVVKRYAPTDTPEKIEADLDSVL
jgi:glutathione peroxidase